MLLQIFGFMITLLLLLPELLLTPFFVVYHGLTEGFY